MEQMNTPAALPDARIGRPRNADKAERQAKLLNAAEELFLGQGYGRVSLEAIARRARVAVRTIYVKFGGKAGLLNALIEAGRSRYFDGMLDLDSDPRRVDAILADFALRYIELLSQPQHLKLYRMVIAEAESTPEFAETFFRAGPLQTREQLVRFFRRADIAAQLGSDLPADFLALHFLNCLVGDQTTRLLFGADAAYDGRSPELQARRGLKQFLQGVRQR